MATRIRIDRLLVERGLVESREKATKLILAGDVFVDGERVDKAGALISPEAEVELRGRSPYVSRGGEKLVHALDHFNVPVVGRICIDVGASTGGFTDCLLQRGAARVYAVDVGTGQLDARLRRDPRVVVMEQTNARALDPRIFPEHPSLGVIDVAFISLEKVLPAVFGVLSPRADVITLVKPQFEVGRELVGKGGVVRDPALHRQAVGRLARYSVLRGWHVLGVTASPLRGPKGNREFFLHLCTHGRTVANIETMISRTVEALA
ncbi:MAG: TlyA family rRNA (cytidine-2'-O)-methyltransferase [Candidatus Rokubacteria bacterium 13_1_40CM_69_27]|nr:MAG: TlyA family rRNA (cytidine-2'-O)-methyltransferase [Candidatus Rokubacteria bacterium 13_1_40CM_69_27]OLC33575.1 MAG: TlyA family rRNA (cytidine-2'-O)-methyltransferase [Candidatus Rokubacteria bacterium 13_1_40CM_4_69_5]OLE38778.1 MAG: TlyA family rRNA (cytidine-2'-O)-methyltransferase [Candidatus Rokubacteria bacterium 13_1_20CM_2_70_7]